MWTSPLVWLLCLSSVAALRMAVRPAFVSWHASTRGVHRAESIGMADANELPPTLREWGCDEMLWSKITSKKSLQKLARQGREEIGRARIAKLRELVSAEEAAALGVEGTDDYGAVHFTFDAVCDTTVNQAALFALVTKDLKAGSCCSHGLCCFSVIRRDGPGAL